MTAMKRARVLAGLSHRAAADVVKVAVSTVTKYERPNRKSYSTEIVERMADEYGKRIGISLTVDQLLGRSPFPEVAHAS